VTDRRHTPPSPTLSSAAHSLRQVLDRLTLSPQERVRRWHLLTTATEIGAGVDYVVTTPSTLAAAMNQRRRRQRKPSIRKTIAAAERSGKTVTSITTPDGVTLHFGKDEATTEPNPWPLDDFKVTKQ
jgi:hypothetical protein